MTTSSRSYRIVCNGAKPKGRPRKNQKEVLLEWRRGEKNTQNIRLGLTEFVSHVYHLEDRVLDLLEIASYVFCADRSCTRGRRDSLEFHDWSRVMEFHIKVRDIGFWTREDVQEALSCALCWMTGDKSYSFRFQGGHKTAPAHLFDLEGAIEFPDNCSVALFSGGLDSLAGVAHHLDTTSRKICLVSHRSQPGTVKTQKALYLALEKKYAGRVIFYPFTCTLTGTKAQEETQRSRAFLYSSIAFAVSSALSEDAFTLFENGVTAFNFRKRRDMFGARASRTAHPRTTWLLQELFNLVKGVPLRIHTPFLFKTKADVFEIIRTTECADLISSCTSCSRTYQTLGGATHCGGCTQCIDRRFAAFASECERIDEAGIYAFVFIQDAIEDAETKTALVDFVRQAKTFSEDTVDSFHHRMLDELVEVEGYIEDENPSEVIDKIYELCRRHGHLVRKAIKRMDELFRDPFRPCPATSLFGLIDRGDHLRPPVALLAERICLDLAKALPTAFRRNPPKDENDLNDKIQAYLHQQSEKFEREHPGIVFGPAKAKPDHSSAHSDLWIEAKFIRRGTTPSKASDGIAADMTKYPDEAFKLFVVYDPERAIDDDAAFADSFEKKGFCKVKVIR